MIFIKINDFFLIAFDKYGAQREVLPRPDKIIFDTQKMRLTIAFLLDNFCFNIGAMNIRQDTGTPVSSYPAPYLANSFLYLYENKCILDP